MKYIRVKMELARSKKYNKTEIILIGLLSVYTNSNEKGCIYTNKKLAKDLNISEVTTSRIIKKLIDKGVLTSDYDEKTMRRSIKFTNQGFKDLVFIQNKKKGKND